MMMKIEELTLTRFPEIKDTKHICASNNKIQRNNNRRLINKNIHPVRVEVTARRILSARNHKILDQSNEIHLLTRQIEDLKSENRILKNQAIRHEKALNKIDNRQTELPRILDQHDAEVFNLKELLKRAKDTLNVEIKQHKEADFEVRKLRDTLHRANQLIEDKCLEERNILQQQIKELHEKLYSKEKQLETSSKHIENLEKTHKKEVHSIKKQMKKYLIQCQELGDEMKVIRQSLKEKEKLLQIQNIYSQRFKPLQKSSGNDRLVESFSDFHNDQILQKLNCNDSIFETENSHKNNIGKNHKIAGIKSSIIEEERIKQDIRKILEEEILSGRIKPYEVIGQSSEDSNDNDKSVVQSNDERSTVEDSYNTEKAVQSEIFDKDAVARATENQTPECEIGPETIDCEKPPRKVLLDKLNELDILKMNEKEEEFSNLPYSYPRDNDYLTNDQSISEIETIPVISSQKSVQTETLANNVDDIPHSVSVHKDENDESGNNKLSRPSISKRTQLEEAHNQRNNSNDGMIKDDLLPPLNSSEKKQKEDELLSQLFGYNFVPQLVVHGRPYPYGTRQNRNGGQLWEKNEAKKTDEPKSILVETSQDIKEIIK